eukprot:593775-Prymnesium_polylepis.1
MLPSILSVTPFALSSFATLMYLRRMRPLRLLSAGGAGGLLVLRRGRSPPEWLTPPLANTNSNS